MLDRAEKLIKFVYRGWKSGRADKNKEHPDEETLVSFVEGALASEEDDLVKAHLLSCDICAESVALSLAAEDALSRDVPEELLSRIKNMLSVKSETGVLEIMLKLKDKALEMINSTGDVLVGLELLPASVLRSRSINEFKDEVTILKDFQDIRVEVKIENKGGKAFNLNITIRQKQTQKTIKDLRVTLIKDSLELESYVTDSGAVIFEHVLIGKYTVEISGVDHKLASILLDIKV